MKEQYIVKESYTHDKFNVEIALTADDDRRKRETIRILNCIKSERP